METIRAINDTCPYYNSDSWCKCNVLLKREIPCKYRLDNIPTLKKMESVCNSRWYGTCDVYKR